MSVLNGIGWRRGWVGLIVVTLMAMAMALVCAHAKSDAPEIALVISEPYEDMRKRSSAAIDPAIQNEIWYNIPKSDARLRFIDPDYGFVTPPARFFTVSYDKGMVDSVRMSPQIAPLLLDDALKVVLDLQEQWRQAGWKPIRAEEDPPFADTPEWRAKLRDLNQGGTAYWQAGDKYQAMLVVGRFRDDKRPNEERYLITLALAKPWVEP